MSKLVISLVLCGIFGATTAFSKVYNELPQGGITPKRDSSYSVSFTYSNNQNYCDGSIIEVNGTQLILTSAYCVQYGVPANYKVVGAGLETRQVRRIVVHEDFNSSVSSNALAMIWIDTPFNFTDDFYPIPLPVQGQETTGDVIVSGYPWKRAGILEEYQAPIVPQEECKKMWSADADDVLPSLLCYGPVDKVLCDVEFGSPVRAVDGGYLAGVAFRRQVGMCTNENYRKYPVVAVRISHYVDWIYKTV